MTRWTVAAGLVLGWVYTMSPLLVVTGVGFALLLCGTARIEDPHERRSVLAILTVAIALRILAVGGLFLSADHDTIPFAFLFGDEDYFIRRSIWLRNSALGIPIAAADAIYAFDRAISTSLIWLLATLHLLFGPSPYGVRLVSALCYVAGVVALYRAIRPSFGFPASLFGLVVLLFLPSLFIWSVSVLKEPVFFAVLAAMVALTIAAARRTWLVRIAVMPLLALGAYVAQTVRDGGLIVAGLGTVAGALAGFLLSRPRLLLASMALVLALVAGGVSRGAIQDRVVTGVAAAALGHWEHANAPGHSYTLFEPAFYQERPVPGGMTFEQGARLVAGSLAAYVLMPTPGEMRSAAELAYLPEQVLWYVLIVLAPIGIWAGLQRDRFVTGLLMVHLAVAVTLVALNSGNIGTLVRHRALALPCLVWFSGLGAAALMARSIENEAMTAGEAAAESGV